MFANVQKISQLRFLLNFKVTFHQSSCWKTVFSTTITNLILRQLWCIPDCCSINHLLCIVAGSWQTAGVTPRIGDWRLKYSKIRFLNGNARALCSTYPSTFWMMILFRKEVKSIVQGQQLGRVLGVYIVLDVVILKRGSPSLNTGWRVAFGSQLLQLLNTLHKRHWTPITFPAVNGWRWAILSPLPFTYAEERFAVMISMQGMNSMTLKTRRNHKIHKNERA